MTRTEWIKHFRLNLLQMLDETGYTQFDLARATGMCPATISNYVNGVQTPNVKAILNISYVLGCDSDDLIDFGEPID